MALLSGCASSPLPAASASATVSASAIDAADAERAFGDYLAMADQVAQEGGADVQRIDGLVSPAHRDVEHDIAGAFAANEVHQEGASVYSSFTVQRSSPDRLSAYLCLDTSNLRLLTADGLKVQGVITAAKRTMVVDLVTSDGRIVLDRMAPWSDGSLC
ncbi:hypothetical protein QT381_08385 [Galbitalea sp. SE-J8]|uniref:hypothetical protein n=1 Tax=Galbitalea sp. SE-J8 TaxID=3054952 RepID=UPI00259CBA67|nr:hypothetical protein [Galbitalea sp. SE-J8]MDM4763024.1 hypothetical protein [Galbitalea sp. SE-J8]